MSYIQPAITISHDAHTPELGSFFHSNYTGMKKKKSNPSPFTLYSATYTNNNRINTNNNHITL